MSILKGIKKKEDLRQRPLEDSVEVPSYSPHDFKPLDYNPGEEWNSFEENFEKICLESMAKIKPDEFNGTLMDPLIKTKVELALQEIWKQSNAHQLLIKENLRKLHQGDEICARDKLQHYEEDYQNLISTLTQDREVYYKGTPWEKFYDSASHSAGIEDTSLQMERREEEEGKYV